MTCAIISKPLSVFWYHITLCESVCVIMVKCGPGDTYTEAVLKVFVFFQLADCGRILSA